jgi:hypothetical protein
MGQGAMLRHPRAFSPAFKVHLSTDNACADYDQHRPDCAQYVLYYHILRFRGFQQ